MMVFLTVFGYGQNYQPINSNSLQVFYQETPLPLHPEIWEHNMWGTRIDSVDILPNQDTLFHNYGIYRDTAIENNPFSNDYNTCFWSGAPNWNGYETKIGSNGHAWFYTMVDDSVDLWHEASLNSTWISYVYENSDTLIARIDNVTWADDGWITDSVKTIGFSRYSNGTPVSDPINNVELEIYKHGGFRKMVDMARFPFDTVPIFQVDLNSINRNSPGYSVNGTPSPEPVIGNAFYRVRECSTDWTNGGCIEDTYESQEIIDVQPYGISGQLSATVLVNSQQWLLGSMNVWPNGASCSGVNPMIPPSWTPIQSSTTNIIYDPLPDSLITLIPPPSWQVNLFPRENMAAYKYVLNGALGNQFPSTDYCGPVVKIYTLQSPMSGSCLTAGSWINFAVSYSRESYIAGLGQFFSYQVVVNNFSEYEAECRSYYKYLNVGSIQCGTPLVVSLGEQTATSFSLSPNPATNSVKLRLSDSSAHLGMTASVTDVLGRTITNLELETSNYEVDVSDWPNGVYFIIVTDESQNRFSERIIVQH